MFVRYTFYTSKYNFIDTYNTGPTVIEKLAVMSSKLTGETLTDVDPTTGAIRMNDNRVVEKYEEEKVKEKVGEWVEQLEALNSVLRERQLQHHDAM